MESKIDVFNIVCFRFSSKTNYSCRNGTVFLLCTSGYWMLWPPLSKFSLCFCLFLDQDNHQVFPKHHFCSYIRFLCNCFHLMNCQCRERFDCEWVVFFGPYLCCGFTLSSDSSDYCSSFKHAWLGLESIYSSSPHSSSKLSPVSSFSSFSSANQSFISFETSSNDKKEFVDFLFDIFTPISFTISSILHGNVLDSFKRPWSN